MMRYFYKMKKLALFAALALFCLPLVHAQTAPGVSVVGTTWKGTLHVPDPIECLLRFKKDTLQMIYAGDSPIQTFDGKYVSAADSAVLEAMMYRQHGDTVQLQKVSGGSPCSDEQVGIYLVQLENGKMSLVSFKDPCDARVFGLKGEMTRVR